jgi:hypothetical protein
MKIEPFQMERMQSTWENLVEYDMSESGVRPLTLRELGEMGLDIDATPTFAEVMVVRDDRRAKVARVIEGLTPEELLRQCPHADRGNPTVQTCLHVVLREEWAHNRYANRDLDLLSP